jgi:glycosyltransferase involved in cell wall biosynthesis
MSLAAGASPVSVSIIIPTYNRGALLPTTIISLQKQSYPANQLEIWMVDDGSTDDTAQAVDKLKALLPLAYIQQSNTGATAARNYGASYAKGDVLVFIDDDIELLPDALSNLVERVNRLDRAVVVGTLLASDQLESTGGADLAADKVEGDLVPIPIGKCFTGLLAVKRTHFLALGMFQDPTGGWPNWDDVDFGYRAHLAGYELWRSQTAVAIHHDSAAANLAAAAKRWYKAGYSAVRLFQRHPGIYRQLPMFHDKIPIRWGRDSATLIIRKLARQVSSSWLVQTFLKLIDSISFVQTVFPGLAATLRRWILSGQVFLGVRQGIKEFGDFPE